MPEHPFAPYVRILGKGPHLSRPLTQAESRAAAAMILAGEVEPVQLGAFLCLLRVKTETPEEVAGFAEAVRDSLALPAGMPPVDIDWPSYAGKSRRAPLFVLAALLLAENGITIAMHGTEGHTAGRLYTSATLSGLGLRPAATLEEAGCQLARRHFAYVPMELLNPRLTEIMALKRLLGLRSPLHSVARNINPFDARTSLMSVFHPNYRAVHREAARLMGMSSMACFKGDGGEVERRPEKSCLVEGLRDGADFEEEWPACEGPALSDSPLEPAYLRDLWRGELSDPAAVAVITATAAVALRQTGHAAALPAAEDLARRLWDARQRDGLAA